MRHCCANTSGLQMTKCAFSTANAAALRTCARARKIAWNAEKKRKKLFFFSHGEPLFSGTHLRTWFCLLGSDEGRATPHQCRYICMVILSQAGTNIFSPCLCGSLWTFFHDRPWTYTLVLISCFQFSFLLMTVWISPQYYSRCGFSWTPYWWKL